MRWTTVALLSVVFSVTTLAAGPSDVPDESQLIEHNHYVNKSGQQVHSPAHSKTDAVPTGASARCRDGTFSFSQHRSGTCSHHGGVDTWLGR